MKRGYCGIGIYSPKKDLNVGGLWRSALAFRANFIFTIGARYTKQKCNTCKAERHIPLWHFNDYQDFLNVYPRECALVGVENKVGGSNLANFVHPERAIYLLGAEDHGLPIPIIKGLHHIIELDTQICLNVAVTGSIVLYDRFSKVN
jgi:tRNA(Leu) C34 or U34 (ribose-2'-O)-methylase TrmL